MARNGSGTYTVVNTFVASNTITAAGHNQNWTDAASEITNSVAADGQTTITGQMKGYGSATKTAPAYAFSNDLDTGIYRIGANNLGVSCGDTKILDVATTGLTVVGTLTATTVVGDGVIPSGAVTAYAGASAPTGWLFCDGSSLLRASYAALFTAIGTTYGAADGTHFTLPDMTGRTIAGLEASATRLTTSGGGVDGGTLGAVGGTQSITLDTTMIPSHTHAGTTGTESADHTHGTWTQSGNTFSAGGFGAPSNIALGTQTSGKSATHTHNFTSDATGGGAAHKNVQPTIVLNWIIKT